MNVITSYLIGTLFALGLIRAGMTDPERIIAFLEIGPRWSESLLFVMTGALLVTLSTFPLILKRSKPLLEPSFHISKASKLDRRLILGSILFGAGWGISGYCPGPLVVGLASFKLIPWLCFGFFLFGQWIARRWSKSTYDSCE